MDTSEKSNEQIFLEFQELVKAGQVPKEVIESWLNLAEKSSENLGADSFKKFINKNKKLWFQYVDTPPSASVRHSGHFVDQKLKYKPSSNMISFFNEVRSGDLRNKIQNKEIEVKALGIQLTTSEDRLLNALQRLLHEKSQNIKPNEPGYYMGNELRTLVPFGAEKKESPTISVKPSELYKAFLEKSNYSSHEIKHVRDTLSSLEGKKFLLTYKRTRYEKRKGIRVAVFDIIEEWQGLVKVIKFLEGVEGGELLKRENGVEIEENRGGVVIGLNPILVDQINSKYVEYPQDINKRMTVAAGGSRYVTESMNLLRDFLLRALSAKQQTAEIENEKLIYTLRLDKYLKRRQKTLAGKKVDGAISVAKKLGLIVSHEMSTNKLGLPKHIFHLNPKFNKDNLS